MNIEHFENMDDLFTIYSKFTTEDLEKEREDISVLVSKMVYNPELGPRMAMVQAIIAQRSNAN